MGKLLGFDFTVEYNAGTANTMADTLSWRDTKEASVLANSGPRFDFIDRLRLANTTDPALVALTEAIVAG